jgi:ABC-type lipoprotein release transport system permease subunit
MKTTALAWKNVSRNKRRSILSTVALAITVAVLIFGIGWIQGYGTYVFASMRRFDTGDLQILRQGYREQQGRFPLDLTVDSYTTTRRRLLGLPWVQAAAGRIDFTLRLSNGRDSVPLVGRAVDPAAEATVTTISRYIRAGDFFQSGPGVVIGQTLAERMDLAVGDTVRVAAVNRHGVTDFTHARVVGVFRLGYPLMDSQVALMDLGTAQVFLDLPDAVTRVVVVTRPGQSTSGRVAEYNEGSGGTDLRAYPWSDFAEATVNAVRADSGSFWIMLALMALLSFLGLTNSMAMNVNERIPEIGTLRAIGAKRRDIFALFSQESLLLGLVASVAGALLAAPVALYISRVGFDMGGLFPEDIPIPFGDRFYADYRVVHFCIGVLFGAVAAYIGAILPARRASRIGVAQAMGQTEIG